ncbi:MAG: phosphoenolpyruvate carboxykinase (ATP) [Chloroflexota bacterium]|nr:phosphoenolpyruvate carboxykinase (ATP) [Chloroflexota bacterium]|tara:strand:- start:710 stop:2989 length:2280 start_codon:yes stop_codon:yes gene_type:complete
MSSERQQQSPLAAPAVNPDFLKELDQLVGLASSGQKTDSQYFNPPNDWLFGHISVLQDLPEAERAKILAEASQLDKEAEEANAAGRAATRAWPEVVVRLDSGGLAFFSQLGVVRRPDLTQYFIDGFPKNRDALAFNEDSQSLFAEVFTYINRYMAEQFSAGKTIVQSDRQICDAPGRSFHARQLLFGTRYVQIPLMWRQLTFELPQAEHTGKPHILEVSIPHWLEDLGLPDDLKARINESGLTKLVFKAPTKGLSLHLGFDYVGEHKMGPLSIAMFLVKQKQGLAIQAALSMARVKTLTNAVKNTAVITVGPSLHGKSTLTIMIELAKSELAQKLGLSEDPEEGVYPMNDDIVLLQPLAQLVDVDRQGKKVRITHGIDGTENNFYAMPFGLNQEEDPITFEAVRGTKEVPNDQETLENVPVNVQEATPNYLLNPVRNMRVTLSRPRLIARKNAQHLIETITEGGLSDSVHVPMENTDRIFWQAVMRQNTVIPPLRRLNMEQYIRVLMYGEAVQMGAAVGAIGRPYVEYFSDPFIIGLEDDNASLLHNILREIEKGGMGQEYYVFNTGGVGADSNDEASGAKYRKIPRELTLLLQEALLREAVIFEHDETLGSDIAVAVVNAQGETVLDLREGWIPKEIYGEDDYAARMRELSRRRYYSRDSQDKAGILRYTKVQDAMIDMADIPSPIEERELAWLLSFYWHVDQAYNTLPELVARLGEGRRPSAGRMAAIQSMYEAGLSQGLELSESGQAALEQVGIIE